ncbi:C40 family peptidase [Eubacterium ventriosum]
MSNLQEKAEYPITDISKDKKWIKVERTSTMSGWIKTKDVTVKIHKEYLYTPEEYDDMLEQEWAANAITYTLEETSLPKEGEAAEFLKYATQFLGNRYVWGGTSLTSGADCSGFTMSLFKKFGYSLSRTAAEQAYNGKAVKSNKLKPGDLVFYHTDRKNKNRISHVAIYIGDGKILHSANKTQGVIISRLGNPCAARRILSGKSVKKDKDKDKEKEKTAVVSTKKDIKRLNQETTTEEESSTVEIEKTTQVPNTTEVETTTKVEETESCTDEE